MKVKFYVIALLTICVIVGGIILLFFIYQKNSEALFDLTTFKEEKIRHVSLVKSKNVSRFSFYSDQPKRGYKLGSAQVASLGMLAFGGNDLRFEDNNKSQTFLSKQTLKELVLQHKFTDKPPTAFSNSKTSGLIHYQYQQSINNIPVLGSHLFLHTNDQNELFGIDGNLSTNNQLTAINLNDQQAEAIALATAKKEINKQVNLLVTKFFKIIVNKKILGISDDDTNYLSLAVEVQAPEKSSQLFYKRFYVDLTKGAIIFKENLIEEVLKRRVSSYTSGLVRTEGTAPVSDGAINTVYDTMGIAYNFYQSVLNIDSYDNHGSTIKGVVHLKDPGCPNAFSFPDEGLMYFCDGMYTKDIIGHEMGHLVIGDRLAYIKESGTIMESLADIFAHGVDPNNWTMGEGSALGVLRRYDDPTAKGDPDKLFSNNYYCGSNDDTGIHVNNGVLNKTYYLLSAGGSFNGCNLVGIGQEKAHKIIYKALTTYFPPSANFKDVFDGINRACADFYGVSSIDCVNVQRAMQATELDQQPVGTQKAPRCSGGQEAIPACLSNPSSSPSPTITPGSSPSVQPTSPTLSPVPSSTPRPSLPPLPTVAITPTGNVKINLEIKFQGINKKPDGIINKLYVRLILVSESEHRYQSTGIFSADSNGVFSGGAYFNIPSTELTGKYYILVKGPMHLQKRICDTDPSEVKEGYYRCSIANMTINTGINNFDFSKIILFAGDLTPQDGIVNAYDLSLVRGRLGALPVGPQLYDINLDGRIDTQDYSLIIYALSTRFDD